MRIAVDHRAAILREAARLFARKPFHEVRVEEVAAQTGIAKGTVYRFYRNKEKLYAAVCLELLVLLADELRATAAQARPAEERLGRMIEQMLGHFQRHKDFFHVLQREWGGRPASMQAVFLARRGAIRDLFASVLREGQAAGAFRAVDAVAAADMLLGMMRSLVRFGDPGLAARRTALVWDVFLRGLECPGRRPRGGNGKN